ncbi:plasmid mobilization protein [Acetobacter sp.]|jgi:ABC-type transporter Mla subunit MlaD|uniref:plasmid mobilization protein n=1 Tax=Acetobacter sp. TaxID=440 RepID=UPI0025C06A61|nr:plasmid mobilization relaxosome protein MobC [Acetobacter sp.]MCH4092158.1 MobC family plasmid mobilization relaxosome protein [Acetobacter sp.]MCI1299925.1 MobC family plasmid mobilization relaxosome protein [Acetobacter sp.]MCI1315943.1 MobC family plasmid mobilization relaxosome protein [Acetobacter sp.]
MRKDTRISVRCTRDQLERWNTVARQHGHQTASSFFRELMASADFVTHEKKQLLGELDQATDQIARCGNNLNQIAHHLNAGGHEDASVAVSECRSLLKDMKRIVRDIRQ